MVLSGFIIIVLIVIAILILRMNHARHKISMLIFIAIAIFIILTLTVVNSKYHLDFNSSEGLFKSLKVYGAWLSNGIDNIKSISGYATRLDWTSIKSGNNSSAPKVGERKK
jgi:uncharacterized membrane protein YfhO